MEGIQRKIQRRKQLAGRIAQWVEFQPADYDDTRELADRLCEVTVADDLLSELHKQSKGTVRLIVVGLNQIEQFAKAEGLDSIAKKEWGNNKLFLAHQA